MKNYNWDEESGTLQVSRCNCKSKTQVQAAIDAGKPNIDGFIALYLPTLDVTYTQSEDWVSQNILVETLDPESERTPILNEEGMTIAEEPNPYEVALKTRGELETANPWLAGLRGESAPDRPEFTMTVDDWKTNNSSIYNKYLKSKGVEINGVSVSLNESNQNGLASVSTMIDKAIKLGIDPFLTPINLKLESQSGFSTITVLDQEEFDTVFVTFNLSRQPFFE